MNGGVKLKKLKLSISILMLTFVLVACGSVDKTTTTKNTSGNGNQKTEITGQNSSKYYKTVLKNGKYQVSKSRGVSTQQNSNNFNLKSFDKGMLDISKKVFSTDKYVFQEGQYISSERTQNWLGRYSKKNPSGLNPKKVKGKLVPEYIQQINEQDYLVPVGKNLSLGGMTIGIGVNSIYYYQKEQYGATYEKKLTNDQIKYQGKLAAQKILNRLRKNNKLKNIPIVFALYKQAPDDSLIGGNFYAYSVNKNGANKISSWNKVNQKKYVFPIADGEKSPNSNDASSFNEFKSQVQNYFPNLSGITAQAQYNDGALTGMHVNVNTQFYSQTEVTSFTQYLQTAAQKYLPANAPIDITVSSAQGVQSFLSRGSNDRSFTFHIFDSF
ncbi:CamS family sex pheromone protein [Lactobacillus sp. S2-2]|uniref:CamS family sex pheromone protein n=1 Tax=Lactobacillus sp. S2-2 TaxID=2692917 RepID=UPI001F3035DD|nr:CamS family sex pheromone protein [Lactobacillus sp. S2-2]MCF6514805.1 CamS family sex pheromone protein [Lactobacillus sp. S2-2]